MELERIITTIQVALLFICVWSKNLMVQAYASVIYIVLFVVLLILVC